ncbi:aspartate ammonia-lyase [Arthrobacter sp. MYb211]|uniref:aspartate ammonia-lyase n=1 Tax=unclassified Arthrobacter TaxID=235627 RepID=UPI000CFAAF56|nr:MULTISPECIES: aspartate ammonia-lyase [unclassified Arthrobacter]PRA12334.1 aspartate ammonia-lyase [Arthrobacter sp. MYb221]PRC08797.1 aspartate ammonia-lyase [Arthrobacter sp. MYb211]
MNTSLPNAAGAEERHVPATRLERDSLGERLVPADAYWGISSLRAVENFPISGRPVGSLRSLVWAFGAVKCAAARANTSLGLLDPQRSAAIDQAALEVRDGLFDAHFPVDRIQGGAGTSTNMNLNEVIANRALEILGFAKGAYHELDPIDHVNMGQSTNDTYPTAVKIALLSALRDYSAEHQLLVDSFAAKGLEFAQILKIGRTQLQDAVPMTLGQEFAAFSETLREDLARLSELPAHLSEINLGATAIGTGITAHPEYRALVTRELNNLTGLELVSARDLVEATSDTGVFMLLSGVLKRSAVKLSKICNDLRLLSSGPQTGFNEIFLPAVQAGSSIMPGKVNPVIPEVVNQVAFRVVGADATVTMAVEAGQLQLNAFEPVMVDCLLESLQWLASACHTLRTRCVDGITANEPVLARRMSESVSIITGIAPHIGYANAASLAKESLASGQGIKELVLSYGLVDPGLLDTLLSPANLTGVAASVPLA